MKITKIESNEFEKLLTALSNELVEANIYFKLYLDLNSSKKDYLRELNQSPAFWGLTFNALYETSMIRLCRVYEKNFHTNNLANLLDSIKENLHLFEKHNFKKRLKDNPHVESLVNTIRPLDLKQLNSDIDYTNENNNHLIKNLIVWRHNLIAHRNSKIIIKGTKLFSSHPLNITDILELMDKGMEILNRYSLLFRASSHSTKLVGDDDFRFVLNSVKNELLRHEKEIEEEFAKYQTLSKPQ